jgi:hypothetical protein
MDMLSLVGSLVSSVDKYASSGPMVCEIFAIKDGSAITRNDSKIITFQVLDAVAHGNFKWIPVAIRDPTLDGIATVFGKSQEDSECLICRTKSLEFPLGIAGTYQMTESGAYSFS